MGQPITQKACRQWLKENSFFLATLAGVLLGVFIGLVLRPQQLGPDAILVITYPGELFMRVLKLLILPFVISCIIIGTAGLNVNKNGRIAIRTIVYFISTSALNVTIGLILASFIRPGNLNSNFSISNIIDGNQSTLLDGFLDMGRNIFPDNLFQASFQQTATKYIPGENGTMIRQLSSRDGTNTIGIICFCVMFGSVLGTLGSEKQVVVSFFNTAFQVLIKILMGAIWFTPIGVGSIICGKIISVPDLPQTLSQISWFVVTVTIGVFLYQLVILQSIYFVFLKKNPFQFYWTFKPSIITAFATASKAAAYPITFKIFDDVIKTDKRITRFIIPIGTLNMDGTALFLSVSVVFVAQLNNITLGFGEYATLWIACTLTSMASATVPSAALVLVIMLCGIINAPTDDVSLLFAIDWFVDRLRTTNNLLGDCYACAVVESLSEKELSQTTDLPLKTESNTLTVNILPASTHTYIENHCKCGISNPKFESQDD